MSIGSLIWTSLPGSVNTRICRAVNSKLLWAKFVCLNQIYFILSYTFPVIRRHVSNMLDNFRWKIELWSKLPMPKGPVLLLQGFNSLSIARLQNIQKLDALSDRQEQKTLFEFTRKLLGVRPVQQTRTSWRMKWHARWLQGWRNAGKRVKSYFTGKFCSENISTSVDAWFESSAN